MTKKNSINFDQIFSQFVLPTHLPNTIKEDTSNVVEDNNDDKNASKSDFDGTNEPISSHSHSNMPSSLPAKPIVSRNSDTKQLWPQAKGETGVKSKNHLAEEHNSTSTRTSKAPIPIPGTSIVLTTPEDIQKWIEERKKNWPSKKRILEKEELKKQKIETQSISTSTSSKSIELKGKRPGDNNNEDDERNDIKKRKRICKYFARGNCRNQNCQMSHDLKSAQMEQAQRPLKNNKLVYFNGIPVNIPERYAASLNKGKSLHTLIIENDIFFKEQNEKILDFIEKLFTKKILDDDLDQLANELSFKK
ncbi:hypothetical protein PACTADRAFT_49501 [Pachysolen tannophilus NRRL Y-2460]|uniref:C3H1-type domain-containing protein n=1 Tax=Pachysolen tannophilus NRRL Y-2460 TaxID=669874 RepID=A0A1E4TWN5_PACTA|nr:hypothetical protein PACTADRAFT_49501 [Pachysolen tannophilus NRRL Y-2460]